MKWVFWTSAALVAYTYFGYPIWVGVRARRWPRPAHSGQFLPSVSIVIAAHNEAPSLPRKLANLAALDYPPDRLELVVVSDGSTDSTEAILAPAARTGVRTVVLAERIGKAAALNCAVEACTGEIILFTDARQVLEENAVRTITECFADPEVGCVSGELMLGDPESGIYGEGVGLYWKMEKKVRQWESASGSVVGATGAMYAVRRIFWVPFPKGTILDDVLLPLEVARQGGRVIFESRARAWDPYSPGFRQEFRRKVRTLTGNYQLLQLAPWLLTRRNPLRFALISHKLLRLLVPFALAGILLSSLLISELVYRVVLTMQIAFYASAILALCRPRLIVLSRLGNASMAFLVLNTAAAVACLYFLSGKKEVWR